MASEGELLGDVIEQDLDLVICDIDSVDHLVLIEDEQFCVGDVQINV